MTVWLPGGVLFALTLAASAAHAAPSRYALVIGNNEPEQASRPTLRYADDDAVAMHGLLEEAGVTSVLLTTLDEDSRRLHAGVTPRRPTSSAVRRAVDSIYARMRRDTNPDGTEFLLFYSGHGDVAGGEGFVRLADDRLTRRRLYGLLVRSPAARNHVVVDACKSYFVAFGRGPGGRRTRYQGSFATATLPARLANTGFLLSTSSDRDSHEWERFAAGVFSHEIRSGLRGAADVNLDGRVTYAELGAFLATANEAIPNPRFRPDFVVRPPADDLDIDVLGWPGQPALTLASDTGHVYVEAASGDRIADANPAAGQTLSLHLPATRPLFVRRVGADIEYALREIGRWQLAELAPTAPRATDKGALHMAFERLFAVPFGQTKLDEFVAGQRTAVSLTVEPPEPPGGRRKVQTVAARAAIGFAAVGSVLALASLEQYATGRDESQRERAQRNDRISGLNTAAAISFAAAAVAGGTWLGVTFWPAESPATADTPFGGIGLSLGGDW